MTRMLDIPSDRPRRSRLLLPVVMMLVTLFFVSLLAEARDSAGQGGKAEPPTGHHVPRR